MGSDQLIELMLAYDSSKAFVLGMIPMFRNVFATGDLYCYVCLMYIIIPSSCQIHGKPAKVILRQFY